MSERGWFAVDRGIWDHDLLASSEPFSRREAWLWLISEAAWEPKRRRVLGRVIELQRGQLIVSTRFLASKWRWSVPRVHRFLRELDVETMTLTRASTGAHTITICNYEAYQKVRNTSVNASVTPREGHVETNLTKETNKQEQGIGTRAREVSEPVGRHRISDVHAEFLKVVGVEPDDPRLFGSHHQIAALIARGFTCETILAGAAHAIAGKRKIPTWPYFAKVIETENAERSAPARTEMPHAKAAPGGPNRDGLAAIRKLREQIAGQPPELVTSQMQVLFSAYRKTDFMDADRFMVQVAVVLGEYPDEVVIAVTSPLTGLQRKHVFPPSIAEIVQACDAAYLSIRQRIAWEQERANLAMPKLPPPPPPPPHTPEQQARVDAQVEEARRLLGSPSPKPHIAPETHYDGKHGSRVAADLAARRARQEGST